MWTRTDPTPKSIGRRRVLKSTQSLCIIAPGFNGGQGRYDWEFRITTTNFVVILLLHSTENERVKWKWWTWPSSSTLLNHNTNIKGYFCTREKKCWSSTKNLLACASCLILLKNRKLDLGMYYCCVVYVHSTQMLCWWG